MDSLPVEVRTALDEWAATIAATPPTGADPADVLAAAAPIPPAPPAIDRYAEQVCGAR